MWWLFVNSFNETDHDVHDAYDLCSYLLLLYIMCRDHYRNNIFIHDVLISKLNQRRFLTYLNCPGEPLDRNAAVVVSLIFILTGFQFIGTSLCGI